MVRNGAFRLKGTGEGELMKGVGISTGLAHAFPRRQRRRQQRIIAQRSTGHRHLGGQALNAVGLLLTACFLPPPVAMQRNRASAGGIGAIAALALLHVELVIIQAKPDNDRFSCQVWIDVLAHPCDAYLGIYPYNVTSVRCPNLLT